MLLIGHSVGVNPHDKHVTALELTDISKLLDNIPLCMNGILGETTALRPRSNPIGGNCKNLSPLHQHGDVKACS